MLAAVVTAITGLVTIIFVLVASILTVIATGIYIVTG